MQRLVLLSVSLLALPAHRLRSQGAACTVTDLGAHQFGPTTAAADTGRIYASTISPSGTEFYFFKRGSPAGEDYRIFRSMRTSAGWSVPEQVDLHGNYSDLYPALSSDGRRLVFSSYRPAPGDTSRKPNAHLWYAERTATGWSAPRFIRASQLGYYHSGLTVPGAGRLRYRLTTPDWRVAETREIRWVDTAFTSSVRAPEDEAASYWRSRLGDSVYVWGALETPAGDALLQISKVSQGRRGPGTYFVSRRDATGWALPVPAPDGLSRGAPNFAWFSPDGCFLHYTQDYSTFMRIPTAALTRK